MVIFRKIQTSFIRTICPFLVSFPTQPYPCSYLFLIICYPINSPCSTVYTVDIDLDVVHSIELSIFIRSIDWLPIRAGSCKYTTYLVRVMTEELFCRIRFFLKASSFFSSASSCSKKVISDSNFAKKLL